MIDSTFKTIDAIIKSYKKARHNNDYLTLLNNGLALLEYMPEMISYSVEQESEYRKFEAKLTQEVIEGKARTSSYCETQAKATDYYKKWQYSKGIIELMYNLVNMSKVLARSVDKEFNAS